MTAETSLSGGLSRAPTYSCYVKPGAALSSHSGAAARALAPGPVSFTVDVEHPPAPGAGPDEATAPTLRLVDFLDARGISGTFFTTDAIARATPALVREIAARGHEIGSHGDRHIPLARRAVDEFASGMAAAKARLEDLTGGAVQGFRAPLFSLRPDAAFAIEALRAAGFTYSSSVVPGPAWIGGWPGAPRVPFRWPCGLIECPVPVVRLAGRFLPLLGGMYLRVIPERDAGRLASRLAGQMLWTYCHPYDIDTEAPLALWRGLGPFASLMLHYNRAATLRRWTLLAANAAPPLGARLDEATVEVFQWRAQRQGKTARGEKT